MATRWEIRLDASACMRSGLCAGIAPEHFTANGAELTTVRAAVIEPSDAVVSAAACCPAEAITIHDASTGECVA